MFKKNSINEIKEIELKEVLSLSIYDANIVSIDVLRCLAHSAIETYENCKKLREDGKAIEDNVERALREFAFSLNYIYHSFECIDNLIISTENWKINLDTNYLTPKIKLTISADIDSIFYHSWIDNFWVDNVEEEMPPTDEEEIIDPVDLNDRI